MAATDSIYFSWLGRVTDRFAVKNIPPDSTFDINLDEVNVRSLPALLVSGRPDYTQDSLTTGHSIKTFLVTIRNPACRIRT